MTQTKGWRGILYCVAVGALLTVLVSLRGWILAQFDVSDLSGGWYLQPDFMAYCQASAAYPWFLSIFCGMLGIGPAVTWFFGRRRRRSLLLSGWLCAVYLAVLFAVFHTWQSGLLMRFALLEYCVLIGLVYAAAWYKPVRRIVCVLLGAAVVWGLIVSIAVAGEALWLGLLLGTVMLCAAAVCVRFWLFSDSRVAAVVTSLCCLAADGTLTANCLVQHPIARPVSGGLLLSTVCCGILLVSLLTDTVCIFRAHRRTAVISRKDMEAAVTAE